MKLYLIIFSENFINRDKAIGYLDGLDYIQTWRSDFINCIYVKSEKSAEYISKALMYKFGKGRHLITDISFSEKFGSLPEKSWNFFDLEINIK